MLDYDEQWVEGSPESLKICAWLASPNLPESAEDIFTGLNERILEAGIPIERASSSMMTKHPEVYGKQLIWRKGQPTTSILRSHAVIASSYYMDSPPALVRREKKPMHISLEVPRDEIKYDVCKDLHDAGCTDYLILPVPFANGAHSFISWATARPGGFTAEEVQALKPLVPLFALRLELACADFAVESLLKTYLGENAADRVLDGQFTRGSGSQMKAVIWSCDLRNFTGMVDSHPIGDVLKTLDEFFACVAEPIAAHDGEVLKFIGDAVLAVFPYFDDAKKACENALLAAAEARARAREINSQRDGVGDSEIRFGIGLHLGDVMYGNIGAKDRLDFTVIGRAVNEASRVESMCKELKQCLIVTDDFVNTVPNGARYKSLGTFNLRGVEAKHELFSVVELPDPEPEKDSASQ